MLPVKSHTAHWQQKDNPISASSLSTNTGCEALPPASAVTNSSKYPLGAPDSGAGSGPPPLDALDVTDAINAKVAPNA